jgi:hypothetical protein
MIERIVGKYQEASPPSIYPPSWLKASVYLSSINKPVILETLRADLSISSRARKD